MRDMWNDAAIAEVADLLVYQSILMPQQPSAKIASGVEYIMIDPMYAGLTPNFDGPIVVSLGGGDHHELLVAVLNALAGIDRSVNIAVNGISAVVWDDGPYLITASSNEFNIVNSPESLRPYLDSAALLIGSLGMTAYEAAAAGVPSILTAWSEDHLKTALELQSRGVCSSAGLWDQFNPDDLRGIVDDLLSNRAAWESMSAAGKALVDGQGVKRVAERIEALFAAPEPESEPEETPKHKQKGKRGKA